MRDVWCLNINQEPVSGSSGQQQVTNLYGMKLEHGLFHQLRLEFKP
jgi:hypothetical protein